MTILCTDCKWFKAMNVGCGSDGEMLPFGGVAGSCLHYKEREKPKSLEQSIAADIIELVLERPSKDHVGEIIELLSDYRSEVLANDAYEYVKENPR